ncbi:MAG: flagellar export chaperone FliS [Sterolibacterium sp.]|nr:flagellar export chaperone FliS [Sterolibacterium sp.]
MSKPSTAYGMVGLDMNVEAANPHKLILMLFDGAIFAVAAATTNAQKGDLKTMSKEIVYASNIISQGLRDSLDTSVGGDLAIRLANLYDYICIRLQAANLKGDQAILKEVSQLLIELRGGWEEIADDPAVLSRNKVAA